MLLAHILIAAMLLAHILIAAMLLAHILITVMLLAHILIAAMLLAHILITVMLLAHILIAAMLLVFTDTVVKAGKQQAMVVLHVDVTQQLVELCCSQQVLAGVKSFVDNKYSAVRTPTAPSSNFPLSSTFRLCL